MKVSRGAKGNLRQQPKQHDVSLRVDQALVFGETRRRPRVAVSRSYDMNEFSMVSSDELNQIEMVSSDELNQIEGGNAHLYSAWGKIGDGGNAWLVYVN
jgi:hypothetical protein